MGRGKHVLETVAFIAFFAPGLSADHPSVVNLVPASWRQIGSEQVALADVVQWGGTLAIEREYGVKSLEVRTYRMGDRVAQALFEAAPDPSSAYGLFTFYRTEAMQPEPGMDFAASGPGGALMARGPFFIRVLRPAGSNLSPIDFHSLLVAIGGAKPSEESTASLPPGLPRRGLVRGTVKYLLGPEATAQALPALRPDLIGFGQGAEVEAGAYRLDHRLLTAVIITYPTQQIARQRYALLNNFLHMNQDSEPNPLYGKQKGSFVILVLDAPSGPAAQRLMSQFSVTEQVSWDQPVPSRRNFALQVLELFVSNALLILMLVGITLLSGVFLFFLRRALGKLFPHSQWAQMDGDTTIRLNLS